MSEHGVVLIMLPTVTKFNLFNEWLLWVFEKSSAVTSAKGRLMESMLESKLRVYP
jgi:hypothetical protein